MKIFKCEPLFVILLLIERLNAEFANSKKMFHKLSGNKLIGKAINEVSGVTFENCMALCMYDESCKSLNHHQGSQKSPSRCFFFSVDACNGGMRLIDDPSVDFFDTHNQTCRLGE